MKFLSVFISLFILPALFLQAQDKDSTSLNNFQFTQTIKGTVTDKGNKLPLENVSIKLYSEQISKETKTNEKGEFRLSGLRPGRYILEASHTAYEKLILNEILISSGKESVLNIELDYRITGLNEVIVNGNSGRRPLNQMAMTSARSFSPEETNRYAGAYFDPARMAQSFAGVAAAGDNNEIIVRGNSPKSLQWRLEGIEIVNPNHFGTESSSGGGISMLNTTVLSTSDFYTGGLPAEYGNALSGAFDLKFRKGNTEKNEYAISLGILGAAATFEGPFKKEGNASYLLSYRYSSLSLLEKAGLSVAEDGVPEYQDLSFNFVFPTKKSGTFSLFGIGGLSDIKDQAERDFTNWKERFDSRDMKFGYNAGSIGLKHLYIASNKLYFSSVFSTSYSSGSYTVDTLTNTYKSTLREKSLYKNNSFRYAGSLNYTINSTNTIRAGVNANLFGYNFYTKNFDTESKQMLELINQEGSTSSYDAFIQHKAQISSNITINTGIHSNYFMLSKSWSFEPRLGLNWQLPNDQQLSFGAGIYSRLESLAYYFAKDRTNSTQASNRLEPTKSAQAVLGYEKLLGSGLKFKTEAYYQHLYNVPISIDPAFNFSLLNVSDHSAIYSSSFRQLSNNGTGKNYGIDFSIEKPLNNGYYFMVTSSLFDSKFTALSKQEFNTTFNSRYVGNFLAGKEWNTGRKKNNLFGMNAKVIYTGGRRYTPILLEESIKLDEEVSDQTKINTLTADPYFRLDFSSTFRINSKKAGHLIILDIQNLLNRENVLGMYYNSSKRALEPNKWTGIIPTLNYRIEF